MLTGGCGYVGSHVLHLLLERGYECTILDNLSTGHTQALSGGELITGDVGDQAFLNTLFSSTKFDAILHFAGFIEAGESVENPQKYIENNVLKPINLLEVLRQNKPIPILFSSTAAVYGNPTGLPIKEGSTILPTNPYGLTKLLFEEMLYTYEKAFGFKSVSLRYFNAAGAHESGRIGEDHDPESHLIPLICKTALGKRESIKIFGTNYPTPDGTCIRDYIHVMDLADAHLLALEALLKGTSAAVYNLGNGKGYSVRQVITTVKNITGINFPIIETAPRPGDPAALVASSERAFKELGWIPGRSLDDIVRSAWNWHSLHPAGYEKTQPVPPLAAHQKAAGSSISSVWKQVL